MQNNLWWVVDRPKICNIYVSSSSNKFRMNSLGRWDGVCFRERLASWWVGSPCHLFTNLKEKKRRIVHMMSSDCYFPNYWGGSGEKGAWCGFASLFLNLTFNWQWLSTYIYWFSFTIHHACWIAHTFRIILILNIFLIENGAYNFPTKSWFLLWNCSVPM